MRLQIFILFLKRMKAIISKCVAKNVNTLKKVRRYITDGLNFLLMTSDSSDFLQLT